MSPKKRLERILNKKEWLDEWNEYVGQLPYVRMGGIEKAEAMNARNWERLYDIASDIKDPGEKRKTRKALREFGEYKPNRSAIAVRVRDEPDGTNWKAF